MNEEKEIGEVTHYYSHLEVAIVKFNRKVKVGETVHFKGATTDFVLKIGSIQFDHKDIDEAKKGQEVGIKVSEKVRQGDKVCEVV
ncbi:MAG: translation elongation factor-like protein [Candidatus Colwellbacteria bacterium]|nr:translation elongation factor-like protein [Candidatus Colwellbacteria bacterium]